MSLYKPVRDYMTRDFISISPLDTLESVARRMVEAGCEYALVMDGDELQGLVSVDEVLHEVMSAVVSRLHNKEIPFACLQMIVSELMNNPRTVNFMESCGFHGPNLAISIGESNTIRDAIQLLGQNNLEKVLVLNDKGVVGILTKTNLLKPITELAG